MTFEFQKLVVESDFTKTHKLIYGESGTGKTTFAACMTDKQGRPPYFIFTEKGHGVLNIWGQQITSWEGLIKLKELLTGPKKKELLEKFSCLVLDVGGDMDEMCARYTAAKHKAAHIGDLPHGKGWAAHEEEFKAVLNSLFALMPITLIAHSQQKEFMWNGEIIKAVAPQFSKRVMYYVNGKVDFILYMQPANTKKEHPEITMVPELSRVAKARYPHMMKAFRNHKGNPQQTYKEMLKTFDTTPSPAETIQAADHPLLEAN